MCDDFGLAFSAYLKHLKRVFIIRRCRVSWLNGRLHGITVVLLCYFNRAENHLFFSFILFWNGFTDGPICESTIKRTKNNSDKNINTDIDDVRFALVSRQSIRCDVFDTFFSGKYSFPPAFSTISSGYGVQIKKKPKEKYVTTVPYDDAIFVSQQNVTRCQLSRIYSCPFSPNVRITISYTIQNIILLLILRLRTSESWKMCSTFCVFKLMIFRLFLVYETTAV